MKYCTNCGAELQDQATVCAACGAEQRANAYTRPGQQGAAAYTQQGAYQQQTYQQPQQQTYQQPQQQTYRQPPQQPQQQTYQQPQQQPYRQPYAAAPSIPAEYKPLSAIGYVGYSLLFGLPAVGIIFMIVFALNNDNLNRRNFARSYLLMIVIGIVIAVVLGIIVAVAGVSLLPYISEFAENFAAELA